MYIDTTYPRMAPAHPCICACICAYVGKCEANVRVYGREWGNRGCICEANPSISACFAAYGKLLWYQLPLSKLAVMARLQKAATK